MDLRLVVRTAHGSRDVAVELDEAHTIGQLTAALGAHLGLDGTDLRLHRTQPWARLDADTTVEAAELRVGDRLDLTRSEPAPPPGPPAGAVVLRVTGGPDAGRTLMLPPGTHVVGRDPQADVVLADPFVSRRHLELRVGSGGVEVVDLGSANGTFLRGTRLTEQRPLPQTGDPVELGTTLIAWPDPSVEPRPAPHRTRHGHVVVDLSPDGGPAPDPGVVRLEWEPPKGLFRRKTSAAPSPEDVRAAVLARASELRRADPDLAELRARAGRWDQRLWTRRPADRGFLRVRVGWGERPVVVELDPPVDSQPVATTGALPAVPVTVDLRSGPVAVHAAATVAAGLGRAIVAQLCALHAPEDLVLAVAVTPEHAADWDWAGWLPHTAPRPGAIERPTIATTRHDARDLLATLTQAPEGGAAPAIVVVVQGDLEVSDLGTKAVLLLGTDPGAAPSPAAVVRVDEEDGSVHVSGPAGHEARGHGADQLDVELAGEVATRLAPLVTRQADADRTGDVRLTELLGASVLAPEELTIRWAAPPPGLEAVLGRSATGDATLDLEGDGPHVLVEGPTGGGKTELLRTWIGSLAATYPPERLGIVVVDHHGGGAYEGLAHLPHVATVVTDLGIGHATRLLAALDAELASREELLRSRGAADVQRLRATELVGVPASLVVVIDEAVTLHDDRPDVVERLGRIARKGRQLDVHLIVAGQQLEGRVPDDVTRSSARVTCGIAADAGGSRAAGSARVTGPRGEATFQIAHLSAVRAVTPMEDVTVSDLEAGRIVHRSGSTRIVSAAAARTDLDALVWVAQDAAQRRGVADRWDAWLEQRAASAGRAPDGTRRTLMFTDIVGSTDLVEALGDRAWAALVRWHDQALRDAFDQHDGEEVDHAGDGFFVAFESVDAGLRCAVAIQRALEEHRVEHGFAPQVRIGMHETPVTRDEESYRGRGVHVAARIGAAAEGSEILASTTTIEAATDAFPTTRVRELELKGVKEPVTVAAVRWET